MNICLLVEILPWESWRKLKRRPRQVLIWHIDSERLRLIPLPHRLLSLVLDEPGRIEVIDLDVIDLCQRSVDGNVHRRGGGARATIVGRNRSERVGALRNARPVHAVGRDGHGGDEVGAAMEELHLLDRAVGVGGSGGERDRRWRLERGAVCRAI